MYWVFIVMLLIITIFLSPIYIKIQFNWNKTFKAKINFTFLFGLIKRSIYSKKENIKDANDKNIIVRFKKIKKVYKVNKKYIKYFLDRCEIVELKWITKYGFEDAAVTGITNGVFWSVKNTVLGVFLNNRKVKDIYINVIPDFEEKNFEMDFNCIIKIKTVYIIIVSLYVLITKKGGEKIARSSY
ncbi:DUF2953 domain-containing protein [Anaerosalibacter sp. Marseille-P3206]|uniref:DUF2953 domain-containing protein n=1 Tax=Anaerosalibacter sp. Marseille-P3206 TaxID=1871005 RepID=UPI0009857301|nr:DUF2953 domain-containing protein [Anaerosalibacter sp. Marseille-P3206]